MVGQSLPVGAAPGLLELVLRGHPDRIALLEQAGLDANAVAGIDGHPTSTQLETLLGVALTPPPGDPLFGLRVARDHHYRDLGPLGGLLAASETLEQALLALLQYRTLMLPYLALTLRRQEHQCTLTVGGGETLAVTRTRTHNDLVITALVALGRSLLDGRMPIQRVAFRHSCPPAEQLAEYRSFFRCGLDFDQPDNALVFSPALLGHGLPAVNTARRRDLQQRVEDQMEALKRAGGITGRVLEDLRAGLGGQPLTVHAVADRLGMTARTLQRRLHDEGVQFARLRDQVRMEYACRRLRQGDGDIPDLARRLGFSDIANFYHAFRRWTGSTPGAYRSNRPWTEGRIP